MRILKLQAEAIKRLEVVEITPDGNLVTITGKNSNGKSSVLDSITMALAGERAIPWEPVKRGHETAKITLDLGNDKGLEYRVTRKFTARDGDGGGKKYTTSLTIEDGNGRRPRQTPQSLLDTLVGAIAFDPLEWARMPAKEKVATLRGLVSGVDFDEIADKRQRAFAERTIQKRTAHDARARASGIIVPPQAPDKPIDTKALTDRLAAVGEEAAAIERRRGEFAALERKMESESAQSIALRGRISDLREEIDNCENLAKASLRRHDEAVSAYEALAPLPEPPDTALIRAELDTATGLNAAFAKAQQKAEVEATAKTAEAEVAKLTQEIDDCDKAVQDAIQAAELPVRGLSFDSEDVYLNSIPFDQASDSEKLRASMAIAMAENPTLRVLRIKDGALLDDDAMKILAEVATADDFQIWLEKISDGPTAIEMVDGRVAKGGK